MKKILIIHNRYQNQGGEDVAVENEINFLKKYYLVEEIIFENRFKNYISEIVYLLIGNNYKSARLVKNKINSFSPDVVYVHNTWFKASLSIFKVLQKEKIPLLIKLHNFRYLCTSAFLSKKHLNGKKFCSACGYSESKNGIINKYFKDSWTKSFLILVYGKKYLSILKKDNIKILVLTEFHKKLLSKYKEMQNKVFVFPNLIDIEIKPSVEKENSIVYAGRISEEKGIEQLINAFLSSNLPGVKLKIIGEGPMLKELKNKYPQHNQIEFFNFIKNFEVLKHISTSMAVVSATKLYEGQPTLLCEASLLGIPSVYPSTGGIDEFFPNSYELSYRQFDYQDLIIKLKLLSDKKKIEIIGLDNKKFIQDYLNRDNIIKKFKEIINDQ